MQSNHSRSTLAFRAQVLKSFGAKSHQIDELLDYNKNCFEHPADQGHPDFPLPDEPFVEAWERYATTAKTHLVFDTLRAALVQLNFPIREGISEAPSYRAVVRRGEPVSSQHAVPNSCGWQVQECSISRTLKVTRSCFSFYSTGLGS